MCDIAASISNLDLDLICPHAAGVLDTENFLAVEDQMFLLLLFQISFSFLISLYK